LTQPKKRREEKEASEEQKDETIGEGRKVIRFRWKNPNSIDTLKKEKVLQADGATFIIEFAVLTFDLYSALIVPPNLLSFNQINIDLHIT